LSLGSQRLANLYENAKNFEKKNPKFSFCFKLPEIFTLSEKIFLNRDANPKSRKKNENFESKKKHIMGRTSRTE
jgi:hypothetical protein